MWNWNGIGLNEFATVQNIILGEGKLGKVEI